MAKLLFSWVALIAGAVYGANLWQTGQVTADPFASSIWTGYVFWSLYWGIPVIWRWWRHASPGRRTRSFIGQVFWFFAGLFAVFIGGYFYGVFGGGIYQFFKTWFRVRKHARARHR